MLVARFYNLSPFQDRRNNFKAGLHYRDSQSASKELGTSASFTTMASQRNDVLKSNILSSSMDMAIANKGASLEDILPDALLGEIFSHLCDARDLSRAALVNSSFRNQCRFVKNVRFNCQLKNVNRKRLQDGQAAAPITPFKDTVISMVKNLTCVQQLRLEIEEDVQSTKFKEDVVEKNSLWLSEGSFVRNWLPPLSETLTSLTLIDYGQQAIFHTSPVLQLLSDHCKQLQTLELCNMFLDSKGCNKMNRVTRLTLKCVKLMENGLQDISEMMPMLENVVLNPVVGLREARLKSEHVKVLCVSSMTKVGSVRLDCPSLIKLQIKLSKPDEIKIRAPKLETLAVKLTLRTEDPQHTIIEFEEVRSLRELLIGGSDQETFLLNKLFSQNRMLEKIFIDIPCMAFEKFTGGFRGVQQPVPQMMQTLESLRTCFPRLQSFNAGPGFCHCLQQNVVSVANGEVALKVWPAAKRMLLHFVIQDLELSLGSVTALVKAMPKLTYLEVYVHKDSKIEADKFRQELEHRFPLLELKCGSWAHGMKFDTFN